MWVLLEFFNDYDQHGGYFAGIFNSYDDALKASGHLGRRDFEYSWYEAVEVSTGKLYEVINEYDLVK